ncbi:paralemmin-1-like isoform X1 [Colossoma macropomum]|uniref:paralemmin-1-like isoform X1 n=1 Tax=Colossoma macropomum TaxID=42526 RepID=UPI001864EBA1|nr:paralemmin-1-like isoform X1 [Colossoma macropomum]
MDEAEKYQQRLQAIAEKRRAQEEEDRVRRETEEEWLKLAQRKRKSLRDQWLMEPTPSSTEASGTQTTPWTPTQRAEESAEETQSTQKEIKEEDEKTANMNDEQPSPFMENVPSDLSENNKEEPTQANSGEQERTAGATSETVVASNPGDLLQKGQLERSVLGVLEIQVERDPKTGATTIKSMAPLSSAALDATGQAVFDDGRRTVHAVGEVEGSQHSEEELSQILNAISEEGMQTILNGVAITCNKEQGEQKEKKAETGEPEVEQSSEDAGEPTDLTHDALQQEKKQHRSSAVSKPEEEEGGLNERRDVVDEEERDKVKVREGEVGVEEDEWEVVNCRPEEGLDPVVLTFLGFTQVQTGSGLGYEDEGGLLKVEQVFIASDNDSKVDPSEELSPITAEKIPEHEESTKCEESQPEPGVSLASYSEGTREETSPVVTLQTVCFDVGPGAGVSVPLQELSNVSDIMDVQHNLPHVPTDTTDVAGAAKEVLGDSTEAATENTEEQGICMSRTDVETQRVVKMERKHESDLEDEVFQDVPLDGNGETSQTLIQRETVAQSTEQEPEIQTLVSPSVTLNRAGGETSTKNKTCQCCVVM